MPIMTPIKDIVCIYEILKIFSLHKYYKIKFSVHSFAPSARAVLAQRKGTSTCWRGVSIASQGDKGSRRGCRNGVE
jgi:hypothetical protein